MIKIKAGCHFIVHTQNCKVYWAAQNIRAGHIRPTAWT